MIPVDLKNRFILVYFDVSLDSTSFYIYLLNIHFIFHDKFSCFKYFDIFEVKVQSEVKIRSIDFFEHFKTFLFGDGLKTVKKLPWVVNANGQERCRPTSLMLNMIDDPIRLQNHVHGPVASTFQN